MPSVRTSGIEDWMHETTDNRVGYPHHRPAVSLVKDPAVRPLRPDESVRDRGSSDSDPRLAGWAAVEMSA
jgi:hypothetical protein